MLLHAATAGPGQQHGQAGGRAQYLPPNPVQTLSPTLLRAQQLLDVVLDLGNSTAKPVVARDDRLALVRAANRDAFGLVFQYFRGQWEAIAAKFGPYGAGALLEQVVSFFLFRFRVYLPLVCSAVTAYVTKAAYLFSI